MHREIIHDCIHPQTHKFFFYRYTTLCKKFGNRGLAQLFKAVTNNTESINPTTSKLVLINSLVSYVMKTTLGYALFNTITIKEVNAKIAILNKNRKSAQLLTKITGSDSDVNSEIFLTAQPQQLISGSEADGPFFTAQQAEESG